MIPKIIHHVWRGGKMPELLMGWRAEAVSMHPGWTFYLWRDWPGAEKLLARCSSLAAESNCIRLLAIQKHGGIYLDCDVQCLRPLDGLLLHRAFVAFQPNSKTWLCNAIFGAEPNHPWINWQVERLPQYVEEPAPWGPRLMTHAPAYSEQVTILPERLLYPWGPGQKMASMPVGDAYTAHHWLRRWGVKPSAG